MTRSDGMPQGYMEPGTYTVFNTPWHHETWRGVNEDVAEGMRRTLRNHQYQLVEENDRTTEIEEVWENTYGETTMIVLYTPQAALYREATWRWENTPEEEEK